MAGSAAIKQQVRYKYGAVQQGSPQDCPALMRHGVSVLWDDSPEKRSQLLRGRVSREGHGGIPSGAYGQDGRRLCPVLEEDIMRRCHSFRQ